MKSYYSGSANIGRRLLSQIELQALVVHFEDDTSVTFGEISATPLPKYELAAVLWIEAARIELSKGIFDTMYILKAVSYVG